MQGFATADGSSTTTYARALERIDNSRLLLPNATLAFHRFGAQQSGAGPAQPSQHNAEVTRLNDRPPILNLPEAEGFRFDSGSAELGEDFSRRLEADIIPKLNRFCLQYEAQIDTLEIIGHTDGQAVSARGGRGSNLDDKLRPGPDPVGGAGVQCGANADLGLLRALAGANRMRLAQGQGRLARLDVRAYSAGQLVLPDRPGGADIVLEIGDNERRRIEIRLTKLHLAPSAPSQ